MTVTPAPVCALNVGNRTATEPKPQGGNWDPSIFHFVNYNIFYKTDSGNTSKDPFVDESLGSDWTSPKTGVNADLPGGDGR